MREVFTEAYREVRRGLSQGERAGARCAWPEEEDDDEDILASW